MDFELEQLLVFPTLTALAILIYAPRVTLVTVTQVLRSASRVHKGNINLIQLILPAEKKLLLARTASLVNSQRLERTQFWVVHPVYLVLSLLLGHLIALQFPLVAAWCIRMDFELERLLVYPTLTVRAMLTFV